MDYADMIQDSLDYIEDNITAQISAGELAQRAGFSLFHYYRLFQLATGMPLMQYILRRRLLHGIYEIHCGSTGIDAALKHGFATYAGFYKAFKREFSCTPSVFLKSCRAEKPCRINLKQEEHMIVTRKKAAQILKHWNLENEAITDIYYDGTGKKSENAYYVGDSNVLKFTANLGELNNHMAVSKAIGEIGLWAATPVRTVEGRDYIRDGELHFYLTRRLPGKQMAAGELYEGDTASKARFVGEIIGQLHLALSRVHPCVNDANIYDTVKKWALPKAKEALSLPDTFCQAYLDTFGDLYGKLPRQIIHRDPNPGNIICAQEKWGFIDFELSERNIRIYDPCYGATAVLSENFGKDNGKWLDIYRNIICGYDSVVGMTAEERKAVPYVILANQLVCVAWFCDQDKYADLFETNKRMTQWLVSIFTELQVF